MAEKCAFWNEYDSIAGHICYCELAAFNRPVNPNFLSAIGCSPEKRVECMKSMEYAVGKGVIPEELAPPVTTTAAPVLSCDPPPEIAKTLVGVAQKKTSTPAPALVMLALLAGAYISLGAVLFIIVTNDLSLYIGDGLSRLVGGISFSLGLILVVLGGAELFTGNNLLVAGYLDKKITGKQVLNNWFWVYLFNFVGALLVVFLFYFSGIWQANDGSVATRILNIAAAKTSLHAGIAFSNAVLGLAHAMTHQVGGLLDLPIGTISAVLLPYVMRYNLIACVDKYASIAEAMGAQTRHLSKREAAEKAIDLVRELARDVGIPSGLAELGLPESSLPELSKNAINDACFITNPRDADEKDIINIFREALDGPGGDL